MRGLIRRRLFLVSACMIAGSTCWAQWIHKPGQPAKVPIDVAVTFAGERSDADPSRCCFWFKGGGVDAAATLWKGFGLAATVTGDHATGYLPSTDENKVSFLAGPRYTFMAWKGRSGAEDQRRLQLFAQGLVGVAQGFDTRFTNGTTSSHELAIQTGGGLNFYVTKKFGLRPIEMDFVHTQIGATGFSNQNNLRLATGVTWNF